MKIKLFFFLLMLSFSSNIHAGKFDGFSFAFTMGLNTGFLGQNQQKLTSFGGNTQINLGINKNIFDLVFIGGDLFLKGNKFSKPSSFDAIISNDFKFGAYAKGGMRPTENILLYGLVGYQIDITKIQFDRVTFDLLPNQYTNVVGFGIEYNLLLTLALKLQLMYDTPLKFKNNNNNDQQGYTLDRVYVNFGVNLYF